MGFSYYFVSTLNTGGQAIISRDRTYKLQRCIYVWVECECECQLVTFQYLRLHTGDLT